MNAKLFRMTLCALGVILAAAPAQAADAVADFYQGKTIRMIIRSGVGGGYDQ